MVSPHWARLGAASATGSLLALAAQGLLALLLLRSFDAQAAGLFSVLAQLAFFWATLALAQSPLSLLAERQRPPAAAALAAWRSSLQRWLWLLPLVLTGLWWSMSSAPGAMGLGLGLVWLVLLSLTQLSWYLAQSLVLRTRGALAVAAVRLVPAVLALWVLSLAVAWPGPGLSDPLQQTGWLLLATVLGFAAGSLWLGPAWRPQASAADAGLSAQAGADATPPVAEPAGGDDRPLFLKTLHTLSDVGALTLLAVHWQALHGSAAAGQLLVLLRLAGFVPTLVHAAWSQVALAHAAHAPSRAWAALFAGWSLLGLLGLALQGAEAAQWLGPGWQGLSAGAAPVLAWQAGATALACQAHRPLQTGQARTWSWANIGLNLWLMALVLLPQLPADQHLQWLGYGAASAHALLALWLWRLR